jgi:hypothetical protein
MRSQRLLLILITINIFFIQACERNIQRKIDSDYEYQLIQIKLYNLIEETSKSQGLIFDDTVIHVDKQKLAKIFTDHGISKTYVLRKAIVSSSSVNLNINRSLVCLFEDGKYRYFFNGTNKHNDSTNQISSELYILLGSTPSQDQ